MSRLAPPADDRGSPALWVNSTVGRSAWRASARNHQMDLSVGIALGSSIQIGLFVTPVLVLISGFFPAGRMSLEFSRLEIGVIMCSVLVGIVDAGDGRASWFKGVQVLALYLVIAAVLYVLPS